MEIDEQELAQELDAPSTSKRARLDTSVDASVEHVAPMAETVGRSETRDVAREYGRTQGPAGESIPEDPMGSENKSAAEEVSNFSLGIVGPSDKMLDDGDLEGADAALYAADRAQKQGRSEDAVLDALEAAETQYNASHQQEPGKGLASRVEGTLLNGGSSAPGSPRSIARTGSGVKGALSIDEGTRQKVRERIAAGLTKNPNLSEGAQDIERIAAACEQECFLSCSTRTVFFSKAGNAVRLAASLPAAELAELPRIASGQAKQVTPAASGAALEMSTRLAGLQGTILKRS